MRRLQQKEEERARRRRQEGGRSRRKQRVGFRQFFREVRQELKKVAWPTREETVTFSVVVLVTTVVVTVLVFGMDLLFKQGVLKFLEWV